MNEHDPQLPKATGSDGRPYRQFWATCARGFRVRSVWWVVVGAILLLVASYFFFQGRSSTGSEGGFPSYMQNVDR
jgi:hypothetical protein